METITQNSFKRNFKWILIIGWLLVIFSFSNQVGDKSLGLTNQFISWIGSYIPFITEDFTYYFRKLCHFTEYMILAIIFYHFLRDYAVAKKKLFLITILFCFVCACGDEFHQLFIGGRTGQFLDVIIDTYGSITGVFLSNLFHRKQL